MREQIIDAVVQGPGCARCGSPWRLIEQMGGIQLTVNRILALRTPEHVFTSPTTWMDFFTRQHPKIPPSPKPRVGSMDETQPNFDAFWTSRDEEALRLEWRTSQEASDLMQGNPSQEFMALWRTCLHVIRCSPTILLSPRRSLRYVGEDSGDPSTEYSTIWSPAFCEKLGMLVACPLFEGSAEQIVMFLQYAVICRTDDRRPWAIENAVHCNVLHSFAKAVKDNAGELLITYHNLQRRCYQMGGGTTRTKQCEVFNRLGEMTCGLHGNDPFARYPRMSDRGVPIYGVAVEDLDNLIRAINATLAELGLRTVEWYHSVYQEGLRDRSRQEDEALTPERVRQLYEETWLDERREFRRARNRVMA